MQHVLAGVAIAAPLALGLAAAPSSPHGHRVFSFEDPAVVEASDLVVDDGLFLTTNDSGDTGRVFAVDSGGRTVGVTHWSVHPTDTEALAPAGHGHVWVGDIGDNESRRSHVEIVRIPVGRGDRTVHPTTYRLSYPDGPTDAETLLRDPRTGRLYIASKNVFGGILYAVPARLDASRANRLRAVGRVLPVATDGSFFPDGRHVIVRDYSTAVVYDWPSLQPVGSFTLPQQPQGEGIAVSADGSVYVSSEGRHTPVLQVTLPPRIRAVVRPAVSDARSAPTGSATTSADAGRAAAGPRAADPTSPDPTSPDPTSPDPTSPDPTSQDAWPWVAGGLLGLAALVVLVRSLRPR